LLCSGCRKVKAITFIVPAYDGKGTELNYCQNCEPKTPVEFKTPSKNKPHKQSNSKKNAKGSKKQQLL
jgi:hypothetical protein